LRGSDLARPFWGVRVADSGRTSPGSLSVRSVARAEEQDLRDRCAALLVALPEGTFLSHLTAARLWPLPLPRPHGDEPLHVSVWIPSRAPRRPGVVGHHIHDRSVAAGDRRGLPMVDPATLFCQLALQLPLPDLVAVGDALVLRPVVPDSWDERPWVPLRQLEERVDLFRGRGKQSARKAIALIRPGAESRPETLLRLAIVDAGLPEPEVNVEIFDARGRFIGRADLVYRQWRVIVEYDGDQHRKDTKQFDHDVQRLEGFAGEGWQVIRIVGRSFFGNRAACMGRIARALVKAGWRA
jgi:hypothetical protein